MQYAKIIDQAWQITWKHKVLWIFGILSACNSGSSASSDSSYDFLGDSSIILLLACCFVIIIFALSVFGYFALIKGILQITDDKTPTFRELLSYGQDYFWRGMGLVIFLTLIALIPIACIALFFIFNASYFDPNLAIPLLCIFAPIAFLYYALNFFASISLVDQEITVAEAITQGFGMLQHHIGAVFGLGLMLLLLSIFVIIVIAVPTLILSSLFPLSYFSSSQLLLCLVVFSPLLLALAGMAETFTTSIWTLAYLELRGEVSEPAEDA